MRPTIFTLLHMMAIMLGGWTCAEAGFKSFGMPGGLIGGLVGGAFGHIMGRLTGSAMNRLTERYYRRKSTVTLRAYLDESDTAGTYISCLIISILLERGESVDSFRNYVFGQLYSGDVCQRRAGIVNLELCYPVLAAQMKGFNAFAPTTDDLARLKEIERNSGS
ncbi:MAG: hypothetical protein ACYC4U_32650 [Pirellulaceae bacterium]